MRELINPATPQPMITKITFISVNAARTKDAPIRIYEKRPLGAFLYIETRALIIRARTPARMPLKAYWTALISLNSRSTREIIEMIVKDGRTTPKVAQNEPKTPPIL